LGQRVKQPHADPRFRGIPDDAQELARRADQLRSANEQRKARRAPLLGLVARFGRGNGPSFILAHEVAHRNPNCVRMGIPKAYPRLRT
jgi:hypothetical protein